MLFILITTPKVTSRGRRRLTEWTRVAKPLCSVGEWWVGETEKVIISCICTVNMIMLPTVMWSCMYSTVQRQSNTCEGMTCECFGEYT